MKIKEYGQIMRLDLLKTFRYWLSTFTEIRPEVQLKQCCLVRSSDKLLMILVMSPKMGPVSKLVSQKFWAFGTLKLHVWSVSADNVSFAVSLVLGKMSTYLANTCTIKV